MADSVKNFGNLTKLMSQLKKVTQLKPLQPGPDCYSSLSSLMTIILNCCCAVIEETPAKNPLHGKDPLVQCLQKSEEHRDSIIGAVGRQTHDSGTGVIAFVLVFILNYMP